MKQSVKYSQKIADEICKAISTSTFGLKRLCALNPHWPDKSNIFMWCADHPEFHDRYARAKALQIDWLAEEALEIASDRSSDKAEKSNGDPVFSNAAVNRDRLIVDTIKWAASKLQPKKYGMQKIELGASESLLEKIVDKL
jgi:hypothetical protein